MTAPAASPVVTGKPPGSASPAPRGPDEREARAPGGRGGARSQLGMEVRPVMELRGCNWPAAGS